MVPKILVLYGTTDGHTRKVAAALAAALHANGAHVDVVEGNRRAILTTPAYYDSVVVAASLHAGGYQRGVRRWVAAHEPALRTRPTAFVSVCLGVLEHNPDTDRRLRELLDEFSTKTGWHPTVRKIVAGALPYTKYNWLKRWIMRRIVTKAGGDTDASRDYEYTDWEDVSSFAASFYRSVLTGDQRLTHGIPSIA